MTEIFLHGQLGKEFGPKWEVELENRSPAGAVQCIEAMHPGFLNAIARLIPDVEGFQVNADGRDLSDEELLMQGCDEIHFTPILCGADAKGVLTLVAGVALIAAGVAMMVVPGLQPLGAFTLYGGMTVSGLAITLGVSLALGGISRLLMSTPSLASSDPTKQRASYMFSGLVNTVGEGECIPVLFGEVIIGSVVVSAGGEAEDKAGSGKTSGTKGISQPQGHGGGSPIFNRHEQ